MSFQAYLDSVKAQTGKTAEDFKKLAAQKGLSQHGELLAWLKADFGLGHGHANAIIQVIRHSDEPKVSLEDQVARHFTGTKSVWRAPYDGLLAKLNTFGDDVSVATTSSYISLLRKDRKFGIVQVTAKRLDVGLKLSGSAANVRIEEAGSWNAMVTHRVRIDNPEQINAELIDWLHQAYELIG